MYKFLKLPFFIVFYYFTWIRYYFFSKKSLLKFIINSSINEVRLVNILSLKDLLIEISYLKKNNNIRISDKFFLNYYLIIKNLYIKNNYHNHHAQKFINNYFFKTKRNYLKVNKKILSEKSFTYLYFFIKKILAKKCITNRTTIPMIHLGSSTGLDNRSLYNLFGDKNFKYINVDINQQLNNLAKNFYVQKKFYNLNINIRDLYKKIRSDSYESPIFFSISSLCFLQKKDLFFFIKKIKKIKKVDFVIIEPDIIFKNIRDQLFHGYKFYHDYLSIFKQNKYYVKRYYYKIGSGAITLFHAKNY